MEVLLTQLFCTAPKDFVSDRSSSPGSGESSASWWRLHPQSNCQMKRMNQELESCLCFLISCNPASWSKWISWVEYRMRTTQSLPLSPGCPAACLWVPTPLVSSAGERSHSSISPCPHPPLSPCLEASPPSVSPLLSPICSPSQLSTSSNLVNLQAKCCFLCMEDTPC